MSEETNEEVVLDQSGDLINALTNGSDSENQMLLGGRGRIRIAGTIRPGKQVPLQRCTADEKALFAKLEADGVPYDEINRQMGGQPKSKQSKLTMTNVDHFVIRPGEFKRAADANYILKHYADPDGKVRTIPIFFTNSDIGTAIHHGFSAFDGRGQLRCNSYFEGRIMRFRYVEKSVEVPKAQDWKILDSSDEAEATKACGYKVSFKCLYRFSIKGLNGIGDYVLPTGSWNGVQDAVAVLEKMHSRLGRIDGTFHGQHLFNLCKVEEMVKHDGKRKKQWLVTIESAVDQMEVEAYMEPQAVAARSLHALSAFTGCPQPAPVAVPAPVVDDLPPGLGDQPNGAFVPVEPPLDRHAAGVGKLNDLVAPSGLFMADMDNLAASMYSGMVVSELSIETLLEFYKQVKGQLSARGMDFVDDVKSMRG